MSTISQSRNYRYKEINGCILVDLMFVNSNKNADTTKPTIKKVELHFFLLCHQRYSRNGLSQVSNVKQTNSSTWRLALNSQEMPRKETIYFIIDPFAIKRRLTTYTKQVLAIVTELALLQRLAYPDFQIKIWCGLNFHHFHLLVLLNYR